MKDWIQLATQWPVMRRAFWCALVVGAVLIAINHGDAIRLGEMTRGRFVQIGMTLLVPYCVSTYSSVSAMRSQQKRDEKL